MNIYVIQANAIHGTAHSIPSWESAAGIEFYQNGVEPKHRPDAIVSMSISQMAATFKVIARYPDVPLFCYNWDCYEWVWSSPRPGEYDYTRYGDLLRKAKEVWVPSVCTGRRTTQWWGIDNWKVILSSCPYWGYDDVRDDGYALCCLREIPDPWWGMFERCCKEIGIPYRCTAHEETYESYQRAVAHCRFLCAPLCELSTGGLSLLEGYYLGKPCLVSDSEWNGARDYLGDRAVYFTHGDVANFKFKLENMMIDPPVPRGHREYISTHFSDERMVSEMLARIAGCR